MALSISRLGYWAVPESGLLRGFLILVSLASPHNLYAGQPCVGKNSTFVSVASEEEIAESPVHSVAIRAPFLEEKYFGKLVRFSDVTILDLAKDTGLFHPGASPPLTLAGIKAITALSGLEELSLSGRDISKEMLVQLATLPRLRFLDIADTSLSVLELKALSSLPALATLDLSGCNELSAEALSALCGCKRLESLILRSTNVRDGDLASLQSLSSLRALFLSDTQSTGVGLSALSTIPLTELDLRTNMLSDNGLKAVSKFPSLRSLSIFASASLDHGVISDVGLAYLSSLVNLEEFSCNVESLQTAKGFSVLKHFPRMRILYLPNTLDTNCASILGGLVYLTELYVHSWEDLTDANMRLLSAATSLKVLCLPGCISITDDGVASLASLTNLRVLNLARAKLSDKGLTQLAQRGLLKSLTLSGCERITEKGIVAISDLMNLRTLELAGCPEVTDAAVKGIAKMTELQSLCLSETKLTDKGLESLLMLPELSQLTLNGCPSITDEGVVKLMEIKSLKVLRIAMSPNVSGRVKDAFHKRRPDCIVW